MNKKELQEAISATLEEITKIKEQIGCTFDSRELKRLIRKKRELQYLQLWHLEQYERCGESITTN